MLLIVQIYVLVQFFFIKIAQQGFQNSFRQSAPITMVFLAERTYKYL